jgi:hypothetical protein
MTPLTMQGEYRIYPARYSKGNVAIQTPSGDGYKTRAARLIGDHLRGRWSGRERAYIVSQAKARKFEALFAAGKDASCITGELYN